MMEFKNFVFPFGFRHSLFDILRFSFEPLSLTFSWTQCSGSPLRSASKHLLNRDFCAFMMDGFRQLSEPRDVIIIGEGILEG
jgi:hypothetical protein